LPTSSGLALADLREISTAKHSSRRNRLATARRAGSRRRMQPFRRAGATLPPAAYSSNCSSADEFAVPAAIGAGPPRIPYQQAQFLAGITGSLAPVSVAPRAEQAYNHAGLEHLSQILASAPLRLSGGRRWRVWRQQRRRQRRRCRQLRAGIQRLPATGRTGGLSFPGCSRRRRIGYAEGARPNLRRLICRRTSMTSDQRRPRNRSSDGADPGRFRRMCRKSISTRHSVERKWRQWWCRRYCQDRGVDRAFFLAQGGVVRNPYEAFAEVATPSPLDDRAVAYGPEGGPSRSTRELPSGPVGGPSDVINPDEPYRMPDAAAVRDLAARGGCLDG